ILVNPNQGIAVGMANNICSFNLTEVCKTTIAYLKNPKCDISKTLLAPDFSTGAQLLYDKDALDQIYQSGRGSVKLRSKYRHDKKNSVIEIFEIPYTTTAEAIIDKIIDLIKAGKVKEITDLRDETDKNGLKITLDIKKSTDVTKLMSKLFKMTPLEDSFSCNFNILIGTSPKVMGIAEILANWTEFRMGCLKRKIKYDINKLTHRLHLLEGLKKILLNIDKAIKIIRDTEKDDDVVPNLMKGFDIDEIQADFIADIKLRNLNKEHILKRLQDVDDLNDELDRLDAIVKDDGEIKKIIIDELKEISKKYGQERKTEIVYEDEAVEFDEADTIEDYNLRVFLTSGNYLKKISHVSLRSSGAHKLKEDDYMVCEWDATNKSDLVLISDKQNAYKIKMHEIADCKASELGHYIPNIIEMEPDEKILYIIPTIDYSGDLLYVFENGKGARVSMKCYETKTNRKKLINAYYGKSKLVGIKFLAQDEDIVIYSSLDKIVIFNSSLMQTKTTRDTMGVALMNMKKKSTLARVEFLRDVEFADPGYYTAKNIPATGYYLKDDDREDTQLSLF
ncbi:MAG: topoisomerase IV, partial [Clostridia bacterium]|nr:topoisomerase IV [Clostridia bacterium]